VVIRSLLALLALPLVASGCSSSPAIPDTIAKDRSGVSWGMSEGDLTKALGQPAKRRENTKGLPEVCYKQALGGDAVRRCYGFVEDKLMWRSLTYELTAANVVARFDTLVASLDLGPPAHRAAYTTDTAPCRLVRVETQGQLQMTSPRNARPVTDPNAKQALADKGTLCLQAAYVKGDHPLGGVFARPRKGGYRAVVADSTPDLALHERRLAVKMAAETGGTDAAGSGMPQACAKLRKCYDAQIAQNPGSRASYEVAWKAITFALKGAAAKSVQKTCIQALKGYSTAPDAPKVCAP